MARHYVGDKIRARGDFDDPDTGLPVDPTEAEFTSTSPSGVATLRVGIGGGIVKDSVGRYHFDYDADASGFWHEKWEGTGSNAGVDENTTYVAPSGV